MRRAWGSVSGAFIVGSAIALAACAPDPSDANTGSEVYQASCASCHGANGGGGAGPALDDGVLVAKYTDAEMAGVIRNGVLTMAAVPGLTDEQIAAVVAFLRAEF